jgi:virginiamycin A acetyltransferase
VISPRYAIGTSDAQQESRHSHGAGEWFEPILKEAGPSRREVADERNCAPLHTMRDTLKAAARLLATLAVVPALVSYRVRAAVMGRDRALEGSSQMLALVPGLVGQYVRRAFLAQALDACHATATIEFGTLFSKAGARIGERAYIGPRCHLGLVEIGRDVMLGPCVHVPSGPMTHGTGDPDRPMREQGGTRTLIHIGDGAWIGSAAVVMADVGRDSVVGAGAVVTRPVPDNVVAGGVPARVIRTR